MADSHQALLQADTVTTAQNTVAYIMSVIVVY